MKKTQRDEFDYGNFIIEYREEKNGPLLFHKMKITDVDTALREAAILNDKIMHDVLIKVNVLKTSA